MKSIMITGMTIWTIFNLLWWLSISVSTRPDSVVTTLSILVSVGTLLALIATIGITLRSNELALRPYLVPEIKGTWQGSGHTVKLVLVNNGKTPAKVSCCVMGSGWHSDDDYPRDFKGIETREFFLSPGTPGLGAKWPEERLISYEEDGVPLHRFFWGYAEYEGLTTGKYRSQWMYKAIAQGQEVVFLPCGNLNTFS